MTGIEMLRKLAGTLRENIGDMQLNSSSGPLWRIIDDIADQIERERDKVAMPNELYDGIQTALEDCVDMTDDTYCPSEEEAWDAALYSTTARD